MVSVAVYPLYHVRNSVSSTWPAGSLNLWHGRSVCLHLWGSRLWVEEQEWIMGSNTALLVCCAYESCQISWVCTSDRLTSRFLLKVSLMQYLFFSCNQFHLAWLNFTCAPKNCCCESDARLGKQLRVRYITGVNVICFLRISFFGLIYPNLEGSEGEGGVVPLKCLKNFTDPVLFSRSLEPLANISIVRPKLLLYGMNLSGGDVDSHITQWSHATIDGPLTGIDGFFGWRELIHYPQPSVSQDLIARRIMLLVIKKQMQKTRPLFCYVCVMCVLGWKKKKSGKEGGQRGRRLTISNIHYAIQWLGYTYLFVGMRVNPFVDSTVGIFFFFSMLLGVIRIQTLHEVLSPTILS